MHSLKKYSVLDEFSRRARKGQFLPKSHWKFNKANLILLYELILLEEEDKIILAQKPLFKQKWVFSSFSSTLIFNARLVSKVAFDVYHIDKSRK